MSFISSTVSEIAALVGGEVSGDEALVLDNISGLENASKTSLSFLTNAKYENLLGQTEAGAVIVSKKINEHANTTLIRVDNPDLAFTKAVSHMMPPPPDIELGISNEACISPDAKIGKDVSVSSGAVVEAGAEIGYGVKIWPGCYVGFNVRIGSGSILYPNSVVMYNCVLGERVILQPCAVVGSDGFGYVWDGEKHRKIPQLGNVILEDDVEIGAHTAIDRARFGSTVIEKGAKLDNLIQIAHNVRVGTHCAFAAQVGIAGSSTIGAGTFMGGQAGMHGHIKVAPQTKVAARSVVNKNITEPGQLLSGDPGKPHKQKLDELRNIKKIGSLLKTVKELERRIEKLES